MCHHRHRILVIGAGSIGERHVRCFSATGRADVTVVEPNEGLRMTISARYGVSALADLDTALGDQHHAAVVATPAPLHVPIASRLAAAGLHLLIEKPLSLTTDGVDEL